MFWCEPKDMALKKVHGLEDLERSVSGSKVFHFDGYVSELSTLTSTRSENGISRMCNYGGNILVFWDVAVVCDGDDDDEIVEICVQKFPWRDVPETRFGARSSGLVPS
jgi:hypothetical protein